MASSIVDSGVLKSGQKWTLAFLTVGPVSCEAKSAEGHTVGSDGGALDHRAEGAAVDRLVVCIRQVEVLEAPGWVLRIVPLHLHDELNPKSPR